MNSGTSSGLGMLLVWGKTLQAKEAPVSLEWAFTECHPQTLDLHLCHQKLPILSSQHLIEVAQFSSVNS